MKRGPKPRNYETVSFRGWVPKALAEAIDATLPHDIKGRPKHGERSRLLIRLLQQYLDSRTPTTDLSEFITKGLHIRDLKPGDCLENGGQRMILQITAHEIIWSPYPEGEGRRSPIPVFAVWLENAKLVSRDVKP